MLFKKEKHHKKDDSTISMYLACEKSWVYEMLMLTAGIMGVYTFVLRGRVFCNAQTANFVMMAVAFGEGNWENGFYYLIPITAYCVGALLSELLPNLVKKIGLLRWDTYLIGFEIIVLFLVGCLPFSVPNQIVQVSINFIASMQYNTFRQAEGIPMATTFCTNHVRQIGIGIAKYIYKKDNVAIRKSLIHLKMIGFFFVGGIAATILCHLIKEKAIWLTLVPMISIFISLIYADLFSERDKLQEKPHGH